MDHGGFHDAYRLWFSGKLTADFLVWGIELLWWARIGKCLELLGGLAIVADIIGPKRLRGWGRSLHRPLTLALVYKLLLAPYEFLNFILNFSLRSRRNWNWGGKLNKLMSLLNVLVTAYMVYQWSGFFERGFSAVVVLQWLAYFILLYYFLGALATWCLVTVAIAVGLLFNVMLIAPVASTLERPDVDKWVKGAATLLLVLGFHFDLLAS